MEIKQSRVLKLLRTLTNQSYTTIFGIFIDFRDWYVIWVEKGEDPFDREFEGWCKTWDTHYDIQEVLEEYPNMKYKKLNAFFTIIKWKSLYSHHYSKFMWSVGVIVGLILGWLLS